jgi:YHS domain-containing protein
VIKGAKSSSYKASTKRIGKKYYYCVISSITDAKTGNKATVQSKTVSVTTKRAAAARPSIYKQPTKSKTIKAGQNYSIKVKAKASLGKLSYQWYSSKKNKSSGGKKISKAMKSSYRVPSRKKGSTYYYCVITNADKGAIKTKTQVKSNVSKVVVK